MNEESLENVQKYIYNNLKNKLYDARCVALVDGNKCNKKVCIGKLCNKHKYYKIREVGEVIYHNHLPGVVGENCPKCSLDKKI